jgi:hypothetical protein
LFFAEHGLARSPKTQWKTTGESGSLQHAEHWEQTHNWCWAQLDKEIMSRPRDRKSSMGLLLRMEAIPRKSGFTYRYHPVGGKPINLGHDKEAAIRKVLDW